MVGIRYFNGGRDTTRIGVAGEIARIEIEKKGKFPAADRYKRILKKKLDDNRKKALGDRLSRGFSLSGNVKDARKMSKAAEQALKEISEKKARKEAKALRQMVIVQPRRYHNGTLNQKGKVYDVAGNLVAQVNTKNGKISTMNGWSLGKYKAKSYLTDLTIQNAITQFSPYFINQRKLEALQQQGIVPTTVHGLMSGPEVINVHGSAMPPQMSTYGSDLAPARQNVGVTAWGVRSDNVWGSYSDNTWGTFSDNVWGGNYSDIWGGIGAPGMWGQKGPNIWGTGSGRNFLRGITNTIAGLFGFSTKKNRDRLRSLNSTVKARTGGSGSRTAAAPTSTSRR